MARPRLLVAVLGALALVGCDNGGAPPPPAPTASFALDLPPCGKPPSPDPNLPPPGALLPPGSRITAVREDPPLVQLNGYVTMTPRQVRAEIEARPGLDIVLAEDEGYEAELLVSDGQWRTFVKAKAVCTEGSLLSEVIAPQDSEAVLPTPAGRYVP